MAAIVIGSLGSIVMVDGNERCWMFEKVYLQTEQHISRTWSDQGAAAVGTLSTHVKTGTRQTPERPVILSTSSATGKERKYADMNETLARF